MTYQTVHYVEITPDYQDQRVDNFLFTYLKGVPRSHVYRVIRKGEVRINKKRVGVSYKLQTGDKLRIPPLRLAPKEPTSNPSAGLMQRIAASVLYEDDSLICLNKPCGIAVHGGSGVSFGIIEIVRSLMPEVKALELIHRLDRETSGCLLIAKQRSALKAIHQAFRDGEVKKTYIAIVEGRWSKRLTKVDAPLVKNQLQSGERMVMVAPEGKPSITEFRLIEHFEAHSLVEVNPLTGRTHQIRVHMAHAGHPIVGDEKYGNKNKRLFLHAQNLSFIHPKTGVMMNLTAPLDPLFAQKHW